MTRQGLKCCRCTWYKFTTVLCYREELEEGAEELKAKIQKYKPKIAVFNGKGTNQKCLPKFTVNL